MGHERALTEIAREPAGRRLADPLPHEIDHAAQMLGMPGNACGSRLTVSVDSIESFATIGHPHVHGSRALLSVFVPHLHPSVAAVTAAGNRCSASSALRVSVEGRKTAHRII